MSLFNLSGLILAIVTIIGYINHRWIKLPDAIGMTAIGLLLSVMVVSVGQHLPGVTDFAVSVVSGINFPELIFHGFLGVLLFAGSLHVDLSALKEQKLPVILLSTVGVLISTLVVGVSVHAMLALLGMDVNLISCLMFGAIISPTDPIAVLAILKKVGVPKSVETKIVGESLFNDGIAVVTFLTLLEISSGNTVVSFGGISLLLFKEVGGAIALGLFAGYAGYRLLRDIRSYQLEVFATLTMAIGGYALAESLHVSAPIAVVVMGLFIGNYGSDTDEGHTNNLQLFWQLLDELLNLTLFAMIGLAIIAIPFHLTYVIAGLMTIPVVLAARFVSVWFPLRISHIFNSRTNKHASKIMAWGGLRGGISVALAVSLPDMPAREIIITMTYVVVVFSLLVQATTLGMLIKKLDIEDK